MHCLVFWKIKAQSPEDLLTMVRNPRKKGPWKICHSNVNSRPRYDQGYFRLMTIVPVGYHTVSLLLICVQLSYSFSREVLQQLLVGADGQSDIDS